MTCLRAFNLVDQFLNSLHQFMVSAHSVIQYSCHHETNTRQYTLYNYYYTVGNVEVLRFLSNKYKKLLSQDDKEGK